MDGPARAALGYRGPAVRYPLGAELGYWGFHRPEAAGATRGAARSRFRRRQSIARALRRRAAALQPLLAVEPRIPQRALYRSRGNAGLLDRACRARACRGTWLSAAVASF